MDSRLEILVTINSQVKELSLYDSSDSAPRVFKRAVDVNKLSSAVGDVTLGLKLPRDARNRALFNFADEIDNAFGFYQVPDYDCQVLVDSVPILEGILRLKEYTPQDIKATIIGKNISWKSTFENKNLRDLTSLRKILFSGAFSKSTNRWSADPISLETRSWRDMWLEEEGGEFDLQMPYIQYENAGWPDPSITPYGGFNQDLPQAGIKIWEGYGYNFTNLLLRNNDVPFSFGDVVPCNYLKTVVRAIFNEANYTVSGTFMEDPQLDNVLIPFSGDNETKHLAYNWGTLAKFKGQSLIVDQQLAILQLEADLWYPAGIYTGWGMYSPQISLVEQDTGKTWSTVTRDYAFSFNYTNAAFGGVTSGGGNIDQFDYRAWVGGDNMEDRNMYICPVHGTYTVEGDFLVDNTARSKDLKARLVFIDNYEPGKIVDAITDDTLTITNSANVVFSSSIFTIAAGASNTISCDFEYEYNPDTSPNIKPFIFIAADNPLSTAINRFIRFRILNFEITPIVDNENLTQLLDPVDFLPDLSIQDFISALAKQFNLEISIKDNTISLDYRTNQILGISNINFDQKCNLRKDATLKKGIGQNNYKFESEDFENRAIAPDTSNFLYTSGLKNVKTESVDLKFVTAGTRPVKWVRDGQNGKADLEIDSLVNVVTIMENDEYDQQNSEVFTGQVEKSFDKPITLLKWKGIQNIGTSSQGLYVGYKFYVTGTIPGFATDLTLQAQFQNGDFPVVEAIDLTPKSTYNNYYRVYLENLKTKIVVELPILWTALDLQNLDLRKAINIEGQLFRIAEIKGFNPLLDKPTKTILLKL